MLLLYLFRGGTCRNKPMSKQETARLMLDMPSLSPYLRCSVRGPQLAWALWVLWCGGCFVVSLAYGLQFDLKQDELIRTGEGDGGNSIFGNIGGDTVAKRWLISTALAAVQDIILNRPLVILLQVLAKKYF